MAQRQEAYWALRLRDLVEALAESFKKLRNRLEPLFTVTPNKEAFITVQKNIAVSGKPERLPDIPIPDGYTLVIKAKNSNTGRMTLGGSPSAAKNSSGDNFSLGKNESVKLGITNANKVFLDATVSGEGVELIVEQD